MRDVIVLVWVGFIFFAAVFFAGISLIQLFQHKKIGLDKGFLLSLSACLVAVMLCLSIWPPVHRVYDDEFTYISQSVNILSLGRPSITLKGSLLQPEIFAGWVNYPKLPGFAWLEAVILFLTKNFEHNYFILNIVLGTLSVAAVYRITWVWTASHAAAWWSAIFLACLPASITYSMSASSDIAGSFFFLLFLLFLTEYGTLKAKRILYAALFCGIYSICIKPFYGIFVILGLTAALYIYRRDGWLDRKLYLRILLNSVCLFLPIISAVPFMLWYHAKQGNGSFSFMPKNFYTSISYLFNYKQNTLLTTLAALTAVGRSIFYRKDNLVNGLAGWLWTGLLMISVFFAGGISCPGKAYSDRYFLFFAFPFVLLAAKGAVDITTTLRSRLLTGLLFIILVINASYASRDLATSTKDGGYYKKTLLLKRMARVIPDKAYVIDECAALVASETPMKSIQTMLFLSKDHPREVVFLKGVYDLTDPHRTVLVENILNTEYLCRPLVAKPFQEADLSVTPFLCTRK